MQIELSRPTLAKLNEDYPKVRDVINASEIEDLMNFLIRILNIKVSNKEEQDNLDFQMPLILDFIKTKFGTLTIPEIKEAFKMFVAKEFPELKVFRMLDCIAVGEVLSAFVNFRNDNLRVYADKKRNAILLPQISESEKVNILKKATQNRYEEFLKKDFIADKHDHIFDFLVEQKKIIVSDSPKNNEWFALRLSIAKKILLENLTSKKAISKDDLQEIKRTVSNIETNNSNLVLVKAKEIILKEYFQKQADYWITNIFE